MALAFTSSIVTKEQLDRLSQAAAGTTGFVNTALSGAVTADVSPAMLVDIAACAEGDTIHDGVVSTSAAAAAPDTAISASDAANPRIDLVVLTSSFAFAVREGTAAADPVPGTLIAGDVELAQISIGAGVTQITSGDVIDRRQAVHVPNTFKYKTAAQSWATDTTFADVTATSGTFSFYIGPNAVWVARYFLPGSVASTGTSGIKLQFTGPATPTSVSIGGFVTKADTVGDASTAAIAQLPIALVTAFSTPIAYASTNGPTVGSIDINPPWVAPDFIFDLHVVVVNGATAGTVTLQAAQNASDANATTIDQGAYMDARRIA